MVDDNVDGPRYRVIPFPHHYSLVERAGWVIGGALLIRDEARRIAVNIAKLPESLKE